MSEANEPGSTVVVVDAGGETTVIENGGGEVEVGSEVSEVEAVEEIADAAVEIARIEADRDVTLAVISAETTEALQASFADQELEQCRLRIAELEGQNTAQQTELETLRSLIPPPSPESEPPSPPATEVVNVVEDGPRESPVAAEQAPEPEPRKRKPHRWI